MIHLTGRGETHTCDGVTRRDFLQVGALGALGVGLSDLAAMEAAGAAKGSKDQSCILIFNLGAPSQMDTWDMGIRRSPASKLRSSSSNSRSL